MRDPILAHKIMPRGWQGYRVQISAKACGGLHYLRGNAKPYFSLTLDCHRRSFPNQCQSGGADHDGIRHVFGERFDDLAALHLSDMDGVPMHALENGLYWLGCSKTTAQGYDQARVMAHFRLSAEQADALRTWVALQAPTPEAGRERLASWIETSRPRWKAEADACIAKHELRVYGDPMPAEVVDRINT